MGYKNAYATKTPEMIRRGIVAAMNMACVIIDSVVYRPAVVKATLFLPRWWNCEFSKASERLDVRWNTGFWSNDDSPAYPGDPCEACGRRASIIVYEDSTGAPTRLCGWCIPEFPITPDTRDAVLLDARDRSIGWFWTPRPPDKSLT
jgi:hypothetical protein